MVIMKDNMTKNNQINYLYEPPRKANNDSISIHSCGGDIV